SPRRRPIVPISREGRSPSARPGEDGGVPGPAAGPRRRRGAGLARGDARGMMPFRGEPRDPCPIGTALERMMHRSSPLLLGLGCSLALVLSCFHAVLFQGDQFAYRDAGHFYYPLYRVVQQEWAAGRWPLWNPWQNGGAPLLGMPMAAVLYPGKLIYALLPY